MGEYYYHISLALQTYKMSSIDLKALNIFLNSPVSQDMIHKLVVTTLQVLPCEDSKLQSPSNSSSKDKALPSLMTFITKLVRYTNVYTGTLMATLVYLNKLKTKLPKNAHGLPCTRHRILLSCLILSSKFHNDSSPKNIHWANYTDGLFNVKDINLMERQLLFLLNWDLKVSNEDMIAHLGRFLNPIKEDLIKSAKMRKFLQKQQQQQQRQLQQQHQQTPRMSRSSSNSSTLSLHYRQSSTSSISTASSVDSSMESSPTSKLHSPSHSHILYENKVDPMIEFTALSEERKLNRMLQELNSTTHY